MLKKNTDAVSKIPALADYLKRIGAEERNFRRFVVKETGENGYPIERAVIQIKDGTISCSLAEHAPTDDEKAAIENALKDAEFPQSIGASKFAVDELRKRLGNNGTFYEFYDRKDGTATWPLVKMVQQVRIKEDGTKLPLPWSYWSDGEWRMMEPDGPLPFWKPAKKSTACRIMIHEGAKAAAYVDALVNDRDATHPWKEELSQYEHWGMIGGALSGPLRTDYDELRRENPKEVVYACDRDYVGESALKTVSKHYGKKMRGIMFGDKFDVSWDMADPMPPEIDFPLETLMRPATWATKPIGEKKKPSFEIRPEFACEWWFCSSPEVFVHRDRLDEMFTKEEFNTKVRAFSHVADTAAKLKVDVAGQVDDLKYVPSQPPGIYTENNRRYINTHKPSIIEPNNVDPGPWIKFMEHLIPDAEERHETNKWCATLMAHPEVRMLYGLLLISETQGVGKGTLAKILRANVGEWNTSQPDEYDVVESNYNYWAAHKRLAICHEIYAGHSFKAYNKLKSLMTEANITVKKKFLPDYEIDNWLHVLACSNSKECLRIEDSDRRWLVPGMVEDALTIGYWSEFNKWLTEKGGLGAIKQWAIKFCEEHGAVVTGAHAPNTMLKKEVAEASYTPGMALAATILDRIDRIVKTPDDKALDEADLKLKTEWQEKGMLEQDELFLLDKNLVSYVNAPCGMGLGSPRPETALSIRKLARSRGWYVAGKENEIASTIKGWGTGIAKARIIATKRTLADIKPTDLDKLERKPVSLIGLGEI